MSQRGAEESGCEQARMSWLSCQLAAISIHERAFAGVRKLIITTRPVEIVAASQTFHENRSADHNLSHFMFSI